MKKRIAILSIFVLSIVGILLLPFNEPSVSYQTVLGLEIHVEMWQYRVNGFEIVYRENFPDKSVAKYELLEYSHHAGVLTTLGQNWIEDQLGDSPATDPAKWIAVSNDASAPSAAWIVIPAEITTDGMGRAPGTYVDDGDGAWNITKTFSPTGSGSCQLTGLYWALSGDFLLCADTFTQVNYEDGDSVTIKWSISVS